MTRKRYLVCSWFLLLPVAALGLAFWADEASAVRGGSDAASAANRGEIGADDLLNAAWDFTPFEEADEGDQALATRRDMGDAGMISRRALTATPLPSRVDNSLLKYFPPILKQSGGSCAQQAAIHNCYCYEVNLLRNTDAKLLANQFPAHWTWNCLNNADGKGSNGNSGFKIVTEMGVPSVDVYGERYGMFKDAGWMTGYDKYFKAMGNRIAASGSMRMRTVQDLEHVKGYLHNHNDPNNPVGGVLYFSLDWKENKRVKVPQGLYEAGKWIYTSWGKGGGHAMTYVGYDDNVGFDFNGDGKITNDVDINGDGKVDLADWERGAFIFADSKGTTFGDAGKAYLMYRVAALDPAVGGTRANVSWVKPLKEYKPCITMALKFTFSDRSALKLTAGAASDFEATAPTMSFKPGIYNGAYKVGTVPMRGKNNNEPIEIGLDLTQFADALAGREKGKFFLKMGRKDGAKATGTLQAASVRYHDENGGLIRVVNFTIPNGGSFGEQPLDLAVLYRGQ